MAFKKTRYFSIIRSTAPVVMRTQKPNYKKKSKLKFFRLKTKRLLYVIIQSCMSRRKFLLKQ